MKIPTVVSFTKGTMPDIEKLLPDTAVILPSPLLKDYTTFKLGGPCTAVVDCRDAATLIATIQTLNTVALEYMVIGQGSNLLVSDEGIDCLVLRYCNEEKAVVKFTGNTAEVSGNALLDALVVSCIDQGVGDLSFCSGIPGTVAGAIVGNAGAFGRQIGDLVESVDVLERDGSHRELTADDLEFDYRTSKLKQTGGVVLSTRLRLEQQKKSVMQTERERILRLRRDKHPDWRLSPCAGSVFRNIEPTSAGERRQAAGWYLEAAGAKDFVVGGARLYEKHANIIIAEQNATAQDVYRLTEKMAEAVSQQFGIQLQREIKLVGNFVS